ncbi:MAG: hypothetical protein H6819_07600 [Phycisphaerales bacterium]|nr:hypothetical protein [Phycisphaerales bacterium]MCB9857641.1 hypothetical protein [Phycisphaerales bacterium]MCB9864802.1 hypothetical protein [Phycisphaerales bacterium]
MTRNLNTRSDEAPLHSDAPRVTATRTPEPPSFGRVALMLALIGAALAGPSAYFALDASEFDPYAIMLGIVMAYVILLVLSQTRRAKQWLCDRALTLAIVTALIIRACTLPFSAIIDLFAGMIAVSVTRVVDIPRTASSFEVFVRTLFTTLIQGVFAVTVFSILTLMIYPIHKRRLIRKDQSGLCIRCGYDLRSTRDRCPECGLPVPIGHRPAALEDDYNPGRFNQPATETAKKE